VSDQQEGRGCFGSPALCGPIRNDAKLVWITESLKTRNTWVHDSVSKTIPGSTVDCAKCGRPRL
jgi:hypothetical protein